MTQEKLGCAYQLGPLPVLSARSHGRQARSVQSVEARAYSWTPHLRLGCHAPLQQRTARCAAPIPGTWRTRMLQRENGLKCGTR